MKITVPAYSSDWEQAVELWNADITRILEWLENAETCLLEVQESQHPTDLISEIKLNKSRLEAARRIVDEIIVFFSSKQHLSEQDDQLAHIHKELARLKKRIDSSSERLEGVIEVSIANSPKETELFLSKTAEPIPTGAPFISSLESQLRKDLWYDRDGVAVFAKVAKSNPQNYIEHYISSPGDVTLLPWDAAEKIINNLGFNTVKLQLILAAHAMNQQEPWSGSFTLSGEDVIKNLGWNNRKDISKQPEIN